MKSYPWYTPYQFAGNKPIWAIDLDGLEEYIYQYTLKNNHATFIKMLYYSEVKPVGGGWGAAAIEKYDKRTGKLMDPKEIGMVQYQYFDESGDRLNIRRNLEGKYVAGENELMQDWRNNLDGSVYMGSNNAKFDGVDDYRRESQDDADAISEEHDHDFDKDRLSGFWGTMSSKSTPANEKAIKLADNLLNKETDNVTGKKVTEKTQARAKTIKNFKLAEFIKKYKVPEKPAGGY